MLLVNWGERGGGTHNQNVCNTTKKREEDI